jgi:hypothetical protein
MDQRSIYDVVDRCGAKVLVFSDHPGFFSSWSLKVSKGGKSYLIENDGRDGWIFFYVELDANKYEEKDRLVSQSLSDSEILGQCEHWLSSLA